MTSNHWRPAGALLLALVLGLPARAETLTLDQAIERALRENRDLRQAALTLENSRYGAEAAGANFAWTLKPEGALQAGDASRNYQAGLAAERRLTDGTLVEAGPRVAETDTPATDPFRTAALRVQVERPLFRRGGTLVNREPLTQAERAVQSARRDLELRRADIVVQTVELHEGLARLQDREQFDRQALERLEQLARLTAARERQGRASRVDSLRAELQLGRARSALQTTRDQLAASRRDYADLLGLAPTSDVSVVAGERLQVDAPAEAFIARVALSNRLDYAQVLQDLEDAERGLKIARRGVQPDISLFARYEWLGTGADYADALNLNDDAWFIGLSGGQDDLLQRSARIDIKRAGAGVLGADLRRESVRAAVERQALNELSSYRRATEQAAVEERNYGLARDRARLTRRLYELDRADNFTVSDAENELLRAQNDMLAARANATLAAYRLLRATGTLIEAPSDLKAASQGVRVP